MFIFLCTSDEVNLFAEYASRRRICSVKVFAFKLNNKRFQWANAMVKRVPTQRKLSSPVQTGVTDIVRQQLPILLDVKGGRHIFPALRQLDV